MFPAHEPNTVLIANGLAGMGIALPTAIAAKLVHPGRNVVTVNGDGGFLMNVQELETAVRLKTPIVNVIWENSQFGSIVWKQDKKFGRHFGTDFTNPDFVKLADAFGHAGLALRGGRGFRPPPAPRAVARAPERDSCPDRLFARRVDLRGTRNGNGGGMSATPGADRGRRGPDAAVHRRRVARRLRRRDARRRGPLDRRDADRVADATPEDAKAALDACCAVQEEWAAHPPRERGEILRRAFEAMIAQRRRARAGDDARDGQAARRVQGRDHLRRRVPPLVLRGGRADRGPLRDRARTASGG